MEANTVGIPELPCCAGCYNHPSHRLSIYSLAEIVSGGPSKTFTFPPKHSTCKSQTHALHSKH